MVNTTEPETIAFPFEITTVEPDITAELLKSYPGEREEFVKVGPKEFFFPSRFRDHIQSVWNFKARPDDIWITTFPRSGTTLTQEMVWLILNELDFERAKQISLNQRYTYFETFAARSNEITNEMLRSNPDDPVMQEYIKAASAKKPQLLALEPDRRFIKTHLQISLLPPSVWTVKSKVIYVARNPKDVVVSLYHLWRLFKPGFNGDFNTFCKYFEQNKVFYGPHFHHVNDAWDRRHEPNVLFIFYEDLIKDLPAALMNIAAFLGKTLTESDIERLCSHLSVESFKANPAINRIHLKAAKVYNADAEDFIRNGKYTGEWQKEFAPEIRERFKRYVSTAYAQTDMRFPEV